MLQGEAQYLPQTHLLLSPCCIWSTRRLLFYGAQESRDKWPKTVGTEVCP